MRILLTNNALQGRGGTEMYLLDVARRLQALGHLPVAFSSELGVAAEEIRRAGVPVVNDLGKLPFRPDVIHGQHHMDTMTALLCLPDVPAVYFCHGAIPWPEKALIFPRIYRYVAVDRPCFERLVCEDGVPEEKITILLNFVDLQRFQLRPPLPPCLQEALIYGKTGTAQEEIIRKACQNAGIKLSVVGNKSSNSTGEPQTVLRRYDLVFAKARAAMEAMAVGCAVVIFDGKACGPLVTSQNFDRLRPLNFGYRAANCELTAEYASSQLAQYNAADATLVTSRIRSEADIGTTVDALVRLYAEVIEEHGRTLRDFSAESKAAGQYFQSLLPILKRARRPGISSKHKLLEGLARKTDKISDWLRA